MSRKGMDMATSKYAHLSFEEMDRIVPELIENHGTYQQKLANAADLVVSKVAGTGDIAKYVPGVGPTYAGLMRGHEDPENVGDLRGAIRGAVGGNLGGAVGLAGGAALGTVAGGGGLLASGLGQEAVSAMNSADSLTFRAQSRLRRLRQLGLLSDTEFAHGLDQAANKGRAFLNRAARNNPKKVIAGAALAALPVLGAAAGGLYGQAKGVDWMMPKKAPAAMPPEEPMKAANLGAGGTGGSAPVLPEYAQLPFAKKYGPEAGTMLGTAAGAVGGGMLTRRLGATALPGALIGGLLGAYGGRTLGRAAIGPDARLIHDTQDALTTAHDLQKDYAAELETAQQQYNKSLQDLHNYYSSEIVDTPNNLLAQLRARQAAQGQTAPQAGKTAAFQEKLRKLANAPGAPPTLEAPEDTGYTPRELHWHERFRPLAGVLGGAALGTAASAPIAARLINKGHPMLGGAAMALGGTTGTVLGGMAAQHSLSTPARIAQAHMIRKSLQEGLAELPPEEAMAGNPDYDSFVSGLATMNKEIANQERDWMARSGRKHASNGGPL